MKILVVSGFLGAGKTTFIKEMIRRCKREFVILENEYGSTDIDQQVLKQSDSADVWNLTEGCVCCTKSADMNNSIVTIESTLSPEYLIVEPSGVGALSNVIRNLQKIQYERICLLRPVTIINGLSFAQDFEQYGDVYRDQLSCAGTILISQPESIDSLLYDQIVSQIRSINDSAEILMTHYTKMDDDWWNSLLATNYEGKKLEAVDEASLGLETFPIKNCSASSPIALMWILENALRGYFGQIIRAKGILKAGSSWLRFDIAGGRYSIEGLDQEEAQNAHPECVFIGRAIDMVALKMAMQSLRFEPGIRLKKSSREKISAGHPYKRQ